MRPLAAVCVLAVLLLAGCTNPPDGPTTGSASKTSASSTSATPTTSLPTETANATSSSSTSSSEGPAGPPMEPGPVMPPPPPPPPAGPKPVVVAIVDTGIRADHQAFATGQVVAWHDFGQGGDSTVPDTLWDPASKPYDEDGHGTAVASMVGGLPSSSQTPSFAPGVRLAIAKANTGTEGFYWEDVANAIEWAVETVGADVVSMSVYSYTPTVLPANAMLDAIAAARSAGVLPVVLAGNGNQNAGVPTMSWMHPPANSPHALVVGGSDESGFPVAPLGSMDAELTALYYVMAACPASTSCYDETQGTSFSTPLAAGFAARLIEESRALGKPDPTPDLLEDILKHSATDGPAPPTLEGYGTLDDAALDRALEAIRTGVVPTQANGQVNEAYVETLGTLVRQFW